MHTVETPTGTYSPASEEWTLVDIFDYPYDHGEIDHVGVWAAETDQIVAAGASMFAAACDANGLGGRALMSTILDRLDDEDREWLARVIVEVQAHGVLVLAVDADSPF